LAAIELISNSLSETHSFRVR